MCDPRTTPFKKHNVTIMVTCHWTKCTSLSTAGNFNIQRVRSHVFHSPCMSPIFCSHLLPWSVLTKSFCCLLHYSQGINKNVWVWSKSSQQQCDSGPTNLCVACLLSLAFSILKWEIKILGMYDSNFLFRACYHGYVYGSEVSQLAQIYCPW